MIGHTRAVEATITYHSTKRFGHPCAAGRLANRFRRFLLEETDAPAPVRAKEWVCYFLASLTPAFNLSPSRGEVEYAPLSN